jgi:DNA-binding PadR family transcriptional regulator
MSLRPVELHVLLAMSSGPLHGYAIARRIAEDSDGRLRLLPGNLYAVIRRLETEGLVGESRRKPAADEDQRRRYYRLTASGRRKLANEARHLEKLVARLSRRLEPALENTKR